MYFAFDSLNLYLRTQFQGSNTLWHSGSTCGNYGCHQQVWLLTGIFTSLTITLVLVDKYIFTSLTRNNLVTKTLLYEVFCLNELILNDINLIKQKITCAMNIKIGLFLFIDITLVLFLINQLEYTQLNKVNRFGSNMMKLFQKSEIPVKAVKTKPKLWFEHDLAKALDTRIAAYVAKKPSDKDNIKHEVTEVKNSTLLIYNRINKSGSTTMSSRTSYSRWHLVQRSSWHYQRKTSSCYWRVGGRGPQPRRHSRLFRWEQCVLKSRNICIKIASHASHDVLMSMSESESDFLEHRTTWNRNISSSFLVLFSLDAQASLCFTSVQ